MSQISYPEPVKSIRRWHDHCDTEAQPNINREKLVAALRRIKDSLVANSYYRSLFYEVTADRDSYQIVFELPEQMSAHLNCLLNRVGRKLVVLVDSKNQKEIVPPCIFKAPQDANLDAVRIQSKNAMHLISIPRIHKSPVRKILGSESELQQFAMA